MLRIRNSKAFTLIELIVVVIIIGVLAGIAAVAYNQFVAQSNTKANIASAKNVAQAMDAASASANAVTTGAISGGVFTVGTVKVAVPTGTTMDAGTFVVSIARDGTTVTGCTVTPAADTTTTAVVDITDC